MLGKLFFGALLGILSFQNDLFLLSFLFQDIKKGGTAETCEHPAELTCEVGEEGRKDCSCPGGIQTRVTTQVLCVQRNNKREKSWKWTGRAVRVWSGTVHSTAPAVVMAMFLSTCPVW